MVRQDDWQSFGVFIQVTRAPNRGLSGSSSRHQAIAHAIDEYINAFSGVA
jgi:hypothetical protein